MNRSVKAPRHIFLEQLSTVCLQSADDRALRVDMRRPSHAGTRPPLGPQGVLMLADPLSSTRPVATVTVSGGKPFF
jgi:hypothetical protein